MRPFAVEIELRRVGAANRAVRDGGPTNPSLPIQLRDHHSLHQLPLLLLYELGGRRGRARQAFRGQGGGQAVAAFGTSCIAGCALCNGNTPCDHDSQRRGLLCHPICRPTAREKEPAHLLRVVEAPYLLARLRSLQLLSNCRIMVVVLMVLRAPKGVRSAVCGWKLRQEGIVTARHLSLLLPVCRLPAQTVPSSVWLMM